MKTFTNKFAGKILSAVCIFAFFLFPVVNSFALKTTNSKSGNKPNATPPSILSGCTPGAAQTDLDVNNVRAHFLTGGDMWWDYSKTSTGQYEVPKGSGLMPIYAGALWVGGYDPGNNLHVAAQTYRNGGNDWWPGPLDTVGQAATITADQCLAYDHHYKITSAEVATFIGNHSAITPAISTWPGNGNTALGQANYLAPFFDANNDGKYNPGDGDYPGFDFTTGDNPCALNGCVPVDHLFGDECVWWVINDKGNIHTETTGLPMGLEVHCQAFSFFTDDEINNMTFVNYRLYNRSSLELDSAFIAQWCDPDLGCATDDWVGCDVSRGLGYVMNGTNNDVACSGELGYGVSPPACGIDFFRGPIATPGDGVDNNHNCVVDEPCEQAIMTHFNYFINGAAYPQNDPSTTIAREWYNYMSGTWENASPLTYGGTGLGGTTNCAYAFPGSTDPYGWGVGGNCTNHVAEPVWSEASVPNTPGDRRFVESAGPFKLLPGAVNVVTVGVVWARSTGGNIASVGLMQSADDKAQKLFDNCFQVLNGPDAPDITIQELDKKLILYLTNAPTSNNYKENYSEYDFSILLTDSLGHALHCIDTTYNFEGYKIYQLKDGTVSAGDLGDNTKARLIAQCDVKNGVNTIVNYIFDQSLNASVPTVEVSGADNGVFHSLVVTTDLFALGDPTIINHKTYYYMATAYGYNNYKPYKQDVPPVVTQNICSNFPNGVPKSSVTAATDGQKLPYKQGRRNIKQYSATPHIPSPYSQGTTMQSSYGDGVSITRIEGNGNGGNVLDLDGASENAILSSPNNLYATPTYLAGKGPINVRVVDPLNVPAGHTFTLKFDSTNIGNSTWKLIDNATNDTVRSDRTIKVGYEQLLMQYGISINIMQPQYQPGGEPAPDGFLEASMVFSDPSKKWLTGLANDDASLYAHWILTGTANPGIDNDAVYETIVGGTWAPYRLCAYDLTGDGSLLTTSFNPAQYYAGPAWKSNSLTQTFMKDLASVNIVMTSDKSKWSRCVVFEMSPLQKLAKYSLPGDTTGPTKFNLRRSPSVDKNGNPATIGSGPSANPNDPNYISDWGMGWFPGYAVNLETGERLNIAFGENSALSGGVFEQNGGDMLWNPTSNVTDTVPYPAVLQPDTSGPVNGGQQYIYVFSHIVNDPTRSSRYDAGFRMDSILSQNGGWPSDPIKRGILKDAMWVDIPLLAKGHSLLESDVTIRLRVAKQYQKGYSQTDTSATPQNNNLPMYKFGTDNEATKTDQSSVAVSALDLINVVPNPYYAYSGYENSGLDTKILITNLPEQCTVSIYNLGGTLIRRITKGVAYTAHPAFDSEVIANNIKTWDGSLVWDLKNTTGTPIASGIYIIHVDVPFVGEKIVKWFGIMRPADIGSY